MAAKGPAVRLPTGRPLGVVLVGGRETLGERAILDGGRRLCNWIIDRMDRHGWRGMSDRFDSRGLCWQNRHIVRDDCDICHQVHEQSQSLKS